ncbi:hypothetical protein [Virgibacillus kimchii]
MKRKLKDVRKGDFINLFQHGEPPRHKKTIPFKVMHIEFRDKQVLDLVMINSTGRKKHFGFLDWEMEVSIANQFEFGFCPTCGQEIKE